MYSMFIRIPQLYVCNKKAHRTSIVAPIVQKISHTPTAVACGMSRGVDSFATLYEYTEQCDLEQYRITHVTFFENGAHHLGGTTNYSGIEKFFCEQRETTKEFCKKYDLELVVLRSNLNVFLADFLWVDPFERTHTYRNIGMALMLQNLIGTYYYSAAFNLDGFSADLSRGCARHEKWMLPHIRTGAFRVYSSNKDMLRWEKTKLIIQDPRTYDYLSVCFMSNKNCGRCVKCVRTMVTLDMLGVLDKYSNSFDVEMFKKNRVWYYAQLYYRWDEFLMKELIDYAGEHKVKIPFASKLQGTALFILKKIFKPIIVNIRMIVARMKARH